MASMNTGGILHYKDTRESPSGEGSGRQERLSRYTKADDISQPFKPKDSMDMGMVGGPSGTSLPPKVRAKAKTAAATVVPRPGEPLDEGDTIEFGDTVEIRNRSGNNHWPKVTCTSRIRPGETAQDAMDRIAGFVADNLAEVASALQE